MFVSLATLGFCIFVTVYGYLLAQFVPKKWYTYLNVLIALGCILFGLLSGLSFSAMGLGLHQLVTGLVVGIIVSVPIVLAIIGVVSVPLFRKFFVDKPAKHTSHKATAYELFVRIPFGTALSEEVVFRGVLLGLLLSSLSPLIAVIVASILFGLWHIIPTYNSLTEDDSFRELVTRKNHHQVLSVVLAVIFTALAGVLFGYLRVRTGSVVAPWIVHTVLNAVAVASGYVVLRYQNKHRSSS